MRMRPVLAVAAVAVAVSAGGLAGYSLAGGSAATAGATPSSVGVVDRAALEAVLAQPDIRPTGVTRTFDLVVEETEWKLVDGVTTEAIAFNGTVPGPTIRVTEGDEVVVNVRNALDQPTSIHWHGLHVPNDQDGVAGVTQDPIAPGDLLTYRFKAPHAGTFMYHAHGPRSREQMDRGLYAPFIIDPAVDVVAADVEATLAIGNWMIGDETGDMAGMSMEYTHFTLNGKAFPDVEPIVVEEGELLRLRLVNPSQTLHPMHLHGMDMAVIAKDGEPLPQPQRLNTLDVAPGDTYDVVVLADNAGTWLFHCHDLHHASNNGVEPGGLIQPIVVRPAGVAEPSPTSSSPLASAGPSATLATPGHTMAPDMTSMPGM